MIKSVVFVLSLSLLTTICLGQSFQAAESVEYDASQNRWIVANGSNMLQIAEDGSLSLFGNGSGSHGTEVMGGLVYTLDGGTSLKAYDLATEEIVFTYNIAGAGFLNGLTNDGNGTLYATDFSNKNILKIDVSNPQVVQHEILIGNTVATPNGILYEEDNNRLLWVTWGINASVRAVDLSDNSMSTLASTLFGNFDGIIRYANGEYLVSSWNPSQIIRFNDDFTEAAEVFPTPSISNPADIGYSPQLGKLAIPVGDDVVFADVVVVGDVNDIQNSQTLNIYPNPASEILNVSFDIKESQDIEVFLYDITGKVVVTLGKQRYSSGEQTIALKINEIGPGSYVCEVKGNDFNLSHPITIKK